jgi:hypothetical protein
MTDDDDGGRKEVYRESLHGRVANNNLHVHGTNVKLMCAWNGAGSGGAGTMQQGICPYCGIVPSVWIEVLRVAFPRGQARLALK